MAIKKTKTPVAKKTEPAKAKAKPEPKPKPKPKPKPEPKPEPKTPKAQTAGDLLTAFAEQTEGKDAATKAKLKIQLKKDLASLKAK